MANTNTASITPQHRRDILSSVEPKRKAPAKNIGEGMSLVVRGQSPFEMVASLAKKNAWYDGSDACKK